MQVKIDDIKLTNSGLMATGGTILIDNVEYNIIEKTEDYAEHRFANSTRYILEDTLTNIFWELIVDYDKLGNVFLDGFAYNNKVLTELERIEFIQRVYRRKTM